MNPAVSRGWPVSGNDIFRLRAESRTFYPFIQVCKCKGTENILDAVSLLVNRLAFKCIQRLGYRKVGGILSGVSGTKSYILAALRGIRMGLGVDFSGQPVSFDIYLVTIVGTSFLQDRELDCRRESQTNFCSKEQGMVTRGPSFRCMNGIGSRSSILHIGFWALLKSQKT